MILSRMNMIHFPMNILSLPIQTKIDFTHFALRFLNKIWNWSFYQKLDVLSEIRFFQKLAFL